MTTNRPPGRLSREDRLTLELIKRPNHLYQPALTVEIQGIERWLGITLMLACFGLGLLIGWVVW